MENRLIGMFADLGEGSKNLTGDLRKEILDKLAAEGITVDNIITTNHNGVLHFRLDEKASEKLAAKLNMTNHNLRHGFESVGNADTTAKYLFNEIIAGHGSTGATSAADRALHGIYTSGYSGTTDVMGQGGSYLFTGKNAGMGTDRPIQIYVSGKDIASRLGFYGNNGDLWGQLNENQPQTVSGSAVKEIMVKGGIPWNEVSFIKLSPSLYTAVIQYFQSQGIDNINGIPLKDFFQKK
jgi:hypothetical protein